MKMLEHLKESIKDWANADEIDNYLLRILKKEVYDKKGLIYGIGHAGTRRSDSLFIGRE